ncbi:MAG: SwmB domain-containing protein [Chloroflexi bacterium]|nr:SwmB domain-containing protein [Chloroflexota bacterium]
MLLVAAALALTLLSDGTPAHAQDAGVGAAERVLLSNLGEATSSGTTALSSNDAEIRFVTATYEPGYIITRVDLKFTGPANSAADLPFVALRNHIGTEITLTGSPTDLGSNTYAFTPDSTARVASNSGYFLLIEGGTMSLAQTLSNTVDTGSGHRWLTVPTDGYTRAHDSTGDTSALTGGAQFLFSIRGRVIQPTVPYVANTGQTNTGNLSLLSDDRAQPFTTGSDAAGYTLHSVTVLMRDSDAAVFRNRPIHPLPDLAIHRGSANGPKVADLPTPPSGWSQEYVLDTPVTLDPSTTYWVVAAGGKGEWDGTGAAEDSGNAAGWSIGDNHEFRTTGNTRAFTPNSSTGALKVGINGPPVNSPATGKPAVTAPTFRVPAVLSVDLSGITDTDGIADAERAVTAYRWQRFASDGVTQQRANIGTAATYTLTDADIGKTIRVTVSFEDDNGFSEGPLASDATSAVWVCPEPDLQGGATLIEGRRQIGVAAYRVGGADRLGYRDILHRQHGTLNDNTFTTTATTSAYTIEAIEKTSTAVWFNLDKDLADADKQALALHVCEEHYALSDFTLSGGGGHEYFLASSQDWSTFDELTFHITEDLVAPSFVEAWGDGTSLVIAFSEKLRPAASLSHSSFSVTKGSNDDTVALASGTPTISGNMVELTLSTAIVATDTNIKVSYNKPSSGSGNRVADLVGNQAASFSSQPVINLPADSVAPTLAQTNPAVLAADGKTLTLTMNESMKTDSLPVATAFTVEATPSGGSEAEVHLDATTPVEVNGSVVTLHLGTPIGHNDTNVKVSYTVPGSGDKLQDRAGNDLASFTDQAVTNNSDIPRIGIEALYSDATPMIALPSFRFTSSKALSADLDLNLEMTQTGQHFSFSEVTLDANTTTVDVQPLAFVDAINEINTDGTATITIVGGDDHLPMPAPRNSATVEAKMPPSGPSVWVSHQQLAYSANEGQPFSIGVVFNAGEGVAQPREGFHVALLTDDTGTATIGDDYTHISANIPVTPADWSATNAGGYTYTKQQDITVIDDGLYEPDAETFVAYLQASQGVSDKLVIPNRNDADGEATISITNVNTLRVLDIDITSTPIDNYYDAGDVIRIKVTFNGDVTVDTSSGTPQFAIELAGSTRQATYLSRLGTSELIFDYTVTTADHDDHDGISWSANSLNPNGGTIHFTHIDVTKQVTASLTHDAQAPLTDHKVDTRKPALEYVEVDGSALTLGYTEDLKTSAPPTSAFSVSVDGAQSTNPTNVAINGNIVTLTLTTAVGPGQSATLSYTKPGQSSNPLQDLSGKEADSFSNMSVDQASHLVNFRATPGDRQVLLEWDQLTDSTLTRYQYRYMSTADSTWNPDWTNIPGSNASATSFRATGLTNGLEYTLQVRPVYTVNAQDEPGDEASIKSTPQGALSAPIGLSATQAGTGQITLTWNDPGDITITGYQYRYRSPSDSSWNPDWTDVPGSHAGTTSHTLSGLDWEVLYTFELRAVRGSTAGPSTQAQGTTLGDTTSPSAVRELRAVVHSNFRIELYFRAPEESGDAALSGFEYRYADSNTVPEATEWETATPTQVSNRTINITGLTADTLYTLEVRAVNANSKQGPVTRVQATTTATPQTSTPSAPTGLTATPDEPDTELVSVDDTFTGRTLPARMSFVDVTLEWEPATDHGNSVIHYVYRFAEGNSVPTATPWQFATSHNSSDELKVVANNLKTSTLYTLEVAAQAGNGTTGMPTSVQITTPDYPGSHYTLSAPSSADEDEPFTITVRRTNRNDGESSVLVEIRGPGENDIRILAAEFGADDDSTTVNYTVDDDDLTTTGRQIRARIGAVSNDTGTYSVEWHIVDINNITTQ